MHDTQKVARESLSRVSCEFRQFRNHIHTRLEPCTFTDNYHQISCVPETSESLHHDCEAVLPILS